MFSSAATTRNTAASTTLVVKPYAATTLRYQSSPAAATLHHRIGAPKYASRKNAAIAAMMSMVMAFPLSGLLDQVLERRGEPGGEEGGEPLLKQPRIVAVFGLAAGDELHRVGGGERVGEGAEHEVHAPDELFAGHLRQRALERGLVALHRRRVHLADQLAHRLVRLRVGAAEKAREVATAALGVFHQAQPRRDEGADDGLERVRAVLGFELLQLGDACRIHRVEPAAEHRLDQRVLRAEVIVDRGEIHAGLAGEQPHRRALEAMLHEELLGGIENAGAGFVLGLDCA